MLLSANFLIVNIFVSGLLVCFNLVNSTETLYLAFIVALCNFPSARALLFDLSSVGLDCPSTCRISWSVNTGCCGSHFALLLSLQLRIS